ncbi:MAG TPA: DedA family protein [Nocardioidaceae bacterium]|nr:DedA family protein [Nocardioidaceae bacterium]
MTWPLAVAGILDHYGLAAVFGCVALEATGIPLPGETVLVLAAGYAGHTGHLPIGWVLAVAIAAAVSGDNVGYLLGRFGGWPLLRRFGRFIGVRDSHLKVGRYLFARHGGRLVFAGRFVSVLRAYAAFLAGANQMPWRRFLIWNAAGGAVWATAWTGAAYLFGSRVGQLPGPVQLGLAGAVVLTLAAATVLLRRRWSTLRRSAEVAFPDPLR